MMNGFMGFGWLFWLLLIGGLFWFIFQTINRNRDISNNVTETPLEILKKRYAKGEITKEEYEQMKHDLT